MAPLSFRCPGRGDAFARGLHCAGGMVIGLVVAGTGLFVLAVVAKHIVAGFGLLAAFRWIHELALFGAGGAQLGMWLFVAATFVAVFLLIFLGLLPRFHDETRKRNQRSVRGPTGPASWSSGWSHAHLQNDIEAPASEQPDHLRPQS